MLSLLSTGGASTLELRSDREGTTALVSFDGGIGLGGAVGADYDPASRRKDSPAQRKNPSGSLPLMGRVREK